jgi:wyosine [tRNA(Phe)-imidazoG37] synthetase (radical SAM superfamily)
MPLPPLEHIVYGPVRSRRLGRSLGINLLPAGVKVCNMNCAYCQYGWTRGDRRSTVRSTGWPAPSRIQAVVGRRLNLAAERNELIDRLTVAGHGEPTLHPAFEDVAERLCWIRDQMAPRIRLAILSNSTTAAWPDVRRGLNLFDERYMKLDAGDPITYARINGPGTSVGAIVDALSGLPRIIVQAMFVTDIAGQADNTTKGAIGEWLGALEQISPFKVHIYTIDRPPALSSLRPVTSQRLREIAEQVHAAGFSAECFPARTHMRSHATRDAKTRVNASPS